MNFIIRQNSAEISKFRGKGKILQLGSKFRSLQKTMGPINDYELSHDSNITVLTNMFAKPKLFIKSAVKLTT